MQHETVCRILLVLQFVAAVIIGLYYRLRAAKAGGPVSRRDEGLPILIGLRAVGGLAWLSLFVYMINPAWMAWSQMELPRWLRLIGGPLGMGVVAMFYWVFRSLGNNVTDTVATRASATLVTTGPYRWVRHPLYSSAGVLIVAQCLLTANWFLMIMGAAAVVLLRARTPIEEAKLIEKFGDAYRNYMRRTGRFVPRYTWTRTSDSTPPALL